jgi:hypothetical protein
MAGDHAPQRSRLRLLALIACALLLGGGQARCSFMSGEDEDEDEDDENGEDSS